MEQAAPQTNFVPSDDDNNNKHVEFSGLHHKPRPHPRFNLSVRQSQPQHRYSTTNQNYVPQQQQQQQQQWNTSYGDLSVTPSTMMDNVKASTTATSFDGCDVIDQSGAVELYFASVRVPASFLAATSFSELFGVELNRNDTQIQQRLQTVCLMFQFATFCLSMIVIILCSQVLTRAMTGGFDPFAETGYEFLFREFHYEFVTVRWSFLISLMGFLFAVTTKILYEFELFNIHGETFVRGHLELGLGVCLIMAGLMLHLSSYVRSTMVGWRNIWDMTCDLIKMLLRRGCSLGYHSELVAMIMALIGVIFVILALLSGTSHNY